MQLLFHTLIARSIPFEFFLPELNSRLWGVGKPAIFVAMPEAPVNKNDCPESGKRDVGLTRQIGAPQSETKTEPV